MSYLIAVGIFAAAVFVVVIVVLVSVVGIGPGKPEDCGFCEGREGFTEDDCSCDGGCGALKCPRYEL